MTKKRFKFALSLLIPLSEGTFRPDQPGGQDLPFTWHEWHEYRFANSATVQDLTSTPERQPWIRLPHQSFKGAQPKDVFLKHIEELLFPGMNQLRLSLDQLAQAHHAPSSDQVEDAFGEAFGKRGLPSRRWIGLPGNEAQERLVIDFEYLKEPRSNYRGKLELSVDGGEVIQLRLGPGQDRYGPVSLGILHLSLNTDGYRTSTHPTSQAGGPGQEWGQLLLKDTVFALSSSVLQLQDKLPSPTPSVSILSRLSLDHSGQRFLETKWPAGRVGSPGKWLFLSRAWIVATYFGVGAGRIRHDDSGTTEGQERTVPGGYFVSVTPPSTLIDFESGWTSNPPKLTAPEIEKSITRQAALARAEEDADVTALTGRILAASTWRGTAILDKGSEDQASPQIPPTNSEDFWSLNWRTLRNLRSFWIQGTILGVLQHQLIKRFANELGLSGNQISTDRMRELYEEWLGFGNLTWWSELTYDRPPTDRLLRSYRQSNRLMNTYSELAADFETYSSFAERTFEKAERQHERETGKALARLQILGTPVIIIGGGAAIAEILGQGLGLVGLGIFVVLALIAMGIVNRFLKSSRSRRAGEDSAGAEISHR